MDWTALLSPEDAPSPEQQRALAQAMRKQSLLGQIAQLSGDEQLAGFGKNLVSGAQDEQQLAQQGQQRRLSLAMEAERQRREQEYRQAELGLGRARLAQDAYAPVQTGAGMASFNKKTGQYGEANPNLPAPKSELSSTRRDALIDRMSARATKEFDPEQWGESGKQLVGQRDRADAVLRLVKDKNGALVNLDTRQMDELAEGVQRILSGGAGSEGRVKSLVPPQTWASGAQAVREWILNEPQGLNQQAFVKRMAETLERERELAQEKIDQSIAKRAGGFRTLRKLDPEGWQQVMVSGGLDPADFDENGAYRPPRKAAQQEGGGGPAITERIAQLKAQNLDAKAIRAQLVKEGLVKEGPAK